MATRIRSVDLLPEIFRTETNKKFLASTLDQMIQPSRLQRVEGYIGRNYGLGVDPKDSYVLEPDKERTNYQLEPAITYKKVNTNKTRDLITYPEILDAIKTHGGDVTRHDRLFSSEFYSWDPFIDYDKFVNFGQYYWLSNGPDPVDVQATDIATSDSYTVTRATDGYQLEGQAGDNPTITLIRGGNYTFEVQQNGNPFWIQASPGTQGGLSQTPNISARDVLGVTNNGEDNGTVTFKVPDSTAQNFYYTLTDKGDVDLATNLRFDQINNQYVDVFLEANDGIDEIRDLEGRTLIFLNRNTDSDPGLSGWRRTDLFDDANFDIKKYEEETEVTTSDLRYSVWRIEYVTGPDGRDYIKLNSVLSIPRNSKVTIQYGSYHSSRVYWKNAEDYFEEQPLLTAASDQLWYQDGNDATKFGVIKVIDQADMLTLSVDDDIVGKKTYTSPNGVAFTNGLKVKFRGATEPASYQDQEYYVEGVGSSIKLLPNVDFKTPETYTNSETLPFDSTAYDSAPFDESLNAPKDADYFTINRASPDKNPWTRSNRWFHVDIINKTAEYNDSIAIIDQNLRGKRPIIEFKSGLRLYNFGTEGKSQVDVIDLQQTDALSNVNGKTGYSTDAYTLVTGSRIIFAKDLDPEVRNKIYQVELIDEDGDNSTAKIINLTVADDGEVAKDQTVHLSSGAKGQGKSYRYDGSAWVEAQQKTKVNQAPLFDIFDTNGRGLGDNTYYPSTNFKGTKLFSYAEGSGAVDPILNQRLKYLNIDNVGDIVFDNNLEKDKFTYTVDSVSTNKSINFGFVHNHSTRTGYDKEIGWKKHNNKSAQYQVLEFTWAGVDLICDVPAKTSVENSVIVYVNNIYQEPSRYSYTASATQTTITFATAYKPKTGDSVIVKLQSDVASKVGFYEIPDNLSNNSPNGPFTDITLGTVRNHYIDLAQHITKLSGSVLGKNNIRDLGDVVPYGNKIVQQGSPLQLAATFTKESNINFFDSLKFSSREYEKFKWKLIESYSKNDFQGTVRDQLDQAMEYVNEGRDSSMPFYWTDTIPSGNVYTETKYTISAIDDNIFDLTQTYDFTKANYKGILIYLNDVQLMKDVDYTIPASVARVDISKALAVNDVLVIREYTSTAGSYLPMTPTTLGMYDRWQPEIITDSTYLEAQTIIVGHDGSKTVGFGDSRDDLLLEFEKRIYNNIKVPASDKIPLKYEDVAPGKFRTTDYTQAEITNILGTDFLSWVAWNRLDYKTQTYDANDQQTWNYSSAQDTVDGELLLGHWRGIFNDFYDTDVPHTHPWRMIGFSERPTWWTTKYGPAPYTSGNEVLWDDLEAGRIWDGVDTYTVDARYKRPGLTSVLPVDDEGNLRTAFNTMTGKYDSLSLKKSWVVGDQGPVETVWRRSSSYAFSVMRLLALTKPAEFFALYADRDLYKRDTALDQIVWDGRSRIRTENLTIHGETTAKHSYINWSVDYARKQGISTTTEIKEVLENMDVQLVYRMASYSDKEYLKVFTEKSSPNSNNTSLLLPDESYEVFLHNNEVFDTVEYSSVIIQKTDDGWAVYGNSKLDPYFEIYTSIPNGNYKTVAVGSESVRVSSDFENTLTKIPYGYVFTNRSTMCDFLISYGRALEGKGMVFDDVDNNYLLDWTQMIREFLYWSQQGWATGSLININPNANRLYLEREQTVVAPIIGQTADDFILNQNLRAISNSDLVFNRTDNQFEVKTTNENAIAYTKMKMTSYEHVLVFDNKSIFNDLIYDPITGSRQNRLKIVGYNTGDWNGNIEAQGFIFNFDNVAEWSGVKRYSKGDIILYKNTYYAAAEPVPPSDKFDYSKWLETEYDQIKKGLLPNLSLKTDQLRDYYDHNIANLEGDADQLGFHLVGFTQRDYLANMGLSDISQVRVYENFIGNKGTNRAVDLFKSAKLPKELADYKVSENWAVKQGTYGASANRSYYELRLDESKMSSNPATIALSSNEQLDVNQTVVLSDIYKQSYKITSANVLPTMNYVSSENNLPSAGYVNVDDVDIQTWNLENLGLIAPYLEALGEGTTIWVAKDNAHDWNIYRVSTVDPNLLSATDNLDGTSTLAFRGNHGLAKNDIIIVRYFDAAINFAYRVQSVPALHKVVVNLTLPTDITVIEDEGIVFKLNSVRVAQPSDVADLPFADEIDPGDKVWINDGGNDGWQVIEKTNPFTRKGSFEPYGNYENSFTDETLVNINFGSALAQNDENLVAMVGADEYDSGIARNTVNITSITKDSPGVISTFPNRHDLKTGDKIIISGVNGMTELNAFDGSTDGTSVFVSPQDEFTLRLYLSIKDITKDITKSTHTVTRVLDTTDYSIYTSGGTIRLYPTRGGSVFTFVETANNEFAQNSILTGGSIPSLEGYGNALAMADKTWAVAGASKSNNGEGYVMVLKQENSNVISEHQLILNPTDANDEAKFGHAVAISDDGRWMYASAPGKDSVYAFQRVDRQLQRFTTTGDGSTTEYTIKDYIMADEPDQIAVVVNNVELTAGVDYTMTSTVTSTGILTLTTAPGDNKSVIVTRRESVNHTGKQGSATFVSWNETTKALTISGDTGNIAVGQHIEGGSYSITSGVDGAVSGTLFDPDYYVDSGLDDYSLMPGTPRPTITAIDTSGANTVLTLSANPLRYSSGTPGIISISEAEITAGTITGTLLFKQYDFDVTGLYTADGEYSVTATVNGVLQRQDVDYDFMHDSSDTFSFDVGYAPADGATVVIRSSDYFEYVATMTGTKGENFGHSIATTTDGRQLIVGAKDANGQGKVYVYDRDVERFVVTDDTDKTYATDKSPQGRATVSLNGQILTDSSKYFGGEYTISGSTVTLATAPSLGDFVEIETNNFMLLDTVEKIDSFAGAEFGYDVTICPTNCSIYASAPKDGLVGPEQGSVQRAVNQSRLYGTITGTVSNPTVTVGEKIRINNVVVTFTGTTLDQVVTDINNAVIPNVTATKTNNKLTISLTNINAGAVANKLYVYPAGDNSDALDDLGLEIFKNVQTITSPYPINNSYFGHSLSVGSDALTLVVSSPMGVSRLPTTFDSRTTEFDGDATEFKQIKTQSGAVYTFDYLGSAPETITNPGRLVFGQQIADTVVGELSEFGHAVNYKANSILVTSPGHVAGDGSSVAGRLAVFTNPNKEFSWKVIRQEAPVVDIENINAGFIYDRIDKEIKTTLDHFDPLQGKILGAVRQNIDIITPTDPAQYNTGTANNSGQTWGKEHVGKIWWNIENIRFINYYQGDPEYRAKRWGQVFPGSTAELYEWMESSQPPANYNGGGTVLSTTSYSVRTNVAPNGTIETKYYFWVKDNPAVVTGKTLSSATMKAYIEDPRSSGISYFSPISSSTVALYNARDFLSAKDRIMHIEFDKVKTDNNVHVEYELIKTNDAAEFLSPQLYKKFIDSYSGVDTIGNKVPDPFLSEADAYGVEFRPRQSMFENRFAALEIYVTRANRVFADHPIAEMRTLTILKSQEEIPVSGSGAWNKKLNSYDELTYQDLRLVATGYKYLVLNDSTNGNLWTIYEVQADDSLLLTRVQHYKTPNYWSYVDWYATGHSSLDKPKEEVATYSRLATIESKMAVGDIAKVTTNADGKFELYERTSTGWNRVALEDGTIKIDSSIYDYTLGRNGFDIEVFDAQYFDAEPVVETRQIIKSINDEILVDDLADHRIDLINLTFEYIKSEQTAVNWLMKTSLVDVQHTLRDLIPYDILQTDNQEFVEKYIEEVKPYHVQIKEFTLKYNGEDLFQGDATDFDLPAQYNETEGTFISPRLSSDGAVGSYLGNAAIWSTGPYTSWYNNYSLSVDSVTITGAGAGYLTTPTVTVTGTATTKAVLEARINTAGQVVEIEVINPGEGYTEPPTITISGGSGSGATAVAVASPGKVRSGKFTIKYDRYEYVSEIVDWTANTVYDPGDLVRYNNKVYRALNEDDSTLVVSGATFDPDDYEIVTADELTGVNRTRGFYAPAVDEAGLDLGLLINGIDYPGVQVAGPTYNQNTGFDVGNYDINPWDNLDYGEEGRPSYSETLLDTKYSPGDYTDTYLGTLATDINVDGGAYIDTYSSHSPEELVPSSIFDTLNIKVFTRPGFDYDGDGHGAPYKSLMIDYTGAVNTFNFGALVENPFAVRAFNVTTGLTLRFEYVSPAVNTVDYTVDWKNKTITFNGNNITAGDVLRIESYGIGGGDQLWVDNYNVADYLIDDSSEGLYIDVPVKFEEIYEAMIKCNGSRITNYTFSSVNDYTTRITFGTQDMDGDGNPDPDKVKYFGTQPLTDADYLHVAIFGYEGDDSTIPGYVTHDESLVHTSSHPTSQILYGDGSTKDFELENDIQGHNAFTAIVEVDGRRLTPAEGLEYTADGSSEGPFYLNLTNWKTTEDLFQTLIADNEVHVYVGYEKLKLYEDYTVSPVDGSSVRYVVLNEAPAAGTDIKIFVETAADYKIAFSGEPVTWRNRLLFNTAPINGARILVTTDNNTSELDILNRNFNGPTAIGTSSSVGYDQTGFDAGTFDETTGTVVDLSQYDLGRTIVRPDRLRVTVNGLRRYLGRDWRINADGQTLEFLSTTVSDNDIVVVTLQTEKEVPDSLDFSIFKDMRDNNAIYRINNDYRTTLTQALSATADTIYVKDASKLSAPDLANNQFGQVMIDGERITYRVRDVTNNTISGLRRGVAGTGAAAHAISAVAYDHSAGTYLDYSYSKTLYELPTVDDGSSVRTGKSLQDANTVPAKFLRGENS